jgi:zinc transporter, ZIP family
MQAFLWALLAASGLVVGAAVAIFFSERLSHRMIAAVMGLGGGILIAVLSVDLMTRAFDQGGAFATVAGFLIGALVFSGINWRLAQHGAKNRNRCGGCVQQPTENAVKGSGTAIAVGALLDGVPESLVVGLSILDGGSISSGLIVGFFLSNVPQGLSSAAGMKKAGRTNTYIWTIWIGVAMLSGAAAALGSLVLGSTTPAIPATILAFAAGGVLAMLAEVMIPEAFEDAQPFMGLMTAVGFLLSFLIIKVWN